MANLEMEAAIEMNADACVVVSGLSDRVNCKKMRVSLQSGNRYSRIKQLVTFSATGTALVEFPSPKGTADMLANETLLQVRGLRSVIPQDGNVTTLEPWEVSRRLRTFLQSLNFPLDHSQQGLESGKWMLGRFSGIIEVATLSIYEHTCMRLREEGSEYRDSRNICRRVGRNKPLGT
ncbi:uncharacterized protein LOC118430952 [Branchiostoma floridae]|uniref:Uncharacterized protein LOC118430952 n=1 Tax=Branchiostoma floridae TaxID=7739 RepID=A0A9J7MD90_BRAFL|nr:uncharacterized protein LOC118430952 [Branchiostoma floridae]